MIQSDAFVRTSVSILALAVFALSGPASAQAPNPAEREGDWMQAVVAQLRSNLIDPGSAQIGLPFGFTPRLSTWKIWGVDTTGYFTCGVVNSRNRFGGYTGNAVFVGIVSPDGRVQTTIDSDRTPMLGRLCETAGLPPVQDRTIAILAGNKSERSATANPDIDEIERLAKMKQAGLITEEEFNKLKARVIARSGP